jgi:transposase InsO family protein
MESKKKPLQTKSVTVTDAQRDQVNREFNTSPSGTQRLFASLREQSLKDGSKPLTLAQVKLVLSDNPVIQATAPPPKPGKVVYQSVVAGAANDSWQADLFFPARTRVSAWLSVVDVFSRRAWVVPMTSSDSQRRTSEQILRALQAVVKAAGAYPKNLNTDLEFQSGVLDAWYAENGIVHHPAPPSQLHRSSLVERWHRTLKGLALRYWLALERRHDLSTKEVERIVDVYNTQVHSTTGQKPEDMYDADGTLPSFQEKVSKEEATARAFKFEVGMGVRTLVKKSVFGGDSSSAIFSERVYRIKAITGGRFTLETTAGEELPANFAFYQLRFAVDAAAAAGDADAAAAAAVDAAAAAREKTAAAASRKKRVDRAQAASGIERGATRGGRRRGRAATAPAARAARLNREE